MFSALTGDLCSRTALLASRKLCAVPIPLIIPVIATASPSVADHPAEQDVFPWITFVQESL